MATPGDLGWTPIESTESSGNWEAFASSENGNVLVGAENGGYIYVSSDSGASWTQRTSAGNRMWYSVATSASGKRIAAVDYASGYIYTSSDYGITWTERTGAGAQTWVSVASSADGLSLVAAAQLGSIYTSQDGGQTWAERTAAGAHAWRNVAVSADGTRIIAADVTGDDFNGGYLYSSNDSGATWGELTSAGKRRWYSVALSADGMRVIAGTDEFSGTGYLYTSTDGGATWVERTGAGAGKWRSVASSASGQKLIAADYKGSAGNGGYIYRSLDGGVTWVEQTGAAERWWVGVGTSADGNRIAAVAYDDAIYRLHRGVDTGASISNFVLGTSTQAAGLQTAISQASVSATGGLCAYIDSLSVLGLDGLDVTAPNNVDIIGGFAYNLSCIQQGGSAVVEIALGELYSNLASLRIYKKVGATLQDVTSQVTLTNKDVNGTTRTVLAYTLTDGSIFDEDTTANSTIVDPIYFGVVNGTSTAAPIAGGLAKTGTNVWFLVAIAVGTIIASLLLIVVTAKGRRMGRT